MAHRLPLPGHRSTARSQHWVRTTVLRRRRVPAPRVETPIEVGCEGYAAESVARALRDILHSATDLLGASRGFLLVCDDAGVMEVACARGLRPADVMDFVLTQASSVVRTVLRDRRLAGADALGRPYIPEPGSDSRHAVTLCMPLDLGDQRSGLLCAMRERNKVAALGSLDFEILHGLCDQASLVIGTSSARSALAQLEACLKGGSPILPTLA